MREKLGSYLAGLWEAGGEIWMPLRKNPILSIVLKEKDRPLGKRILEIIRSGEREKGLYLLSRKGKSVELRVTSVRGLIKVTGLINGKMRTSKREELNKLIDWINKNHSYKIEKLERDKSALGENAWLAGWIESKGWFYIRYSENSQASCKLIIEQRMGEPLDLIASYLEGKVKLNKRKRGEERIKIENQKEVLKIINYLEKYKLYSSKYLDYLNWKEAHKEIRCCVDNNHDLKKEEKIYELKNNMNNKRTKLNWDHLKECRSSWQRFE